MKRGSLSLVLLGIALFAGFAVYLFMSIGDEEVASDASSKQDIKQLVQRYSANQDFAGNASITSTHLIVTNEDKEQARYELPADEFFVSIAPFVQSTHPCEIHSLTGCQGELVEQAFDVLIEDANGEVIVDDTLVSAANGFIDIWLPRDQTYRVKIEYEGKTAVSEISTYEGNNTCITTMQLM